MSDLNYNKKSSFISKLRNAKLGFELWEILTAFTLVLTIASMLLWFSNLQPGYIQDEFIWQDKTKNRLYNMSLQLTNINSTELRSFSLLPSDTICSTIPLATDLDKTIYEKQKQEIKNLKNEVLNLKNETSVNTSYINSVPKFIDLVNNFKNDVDQADNFLEKKLYLSGLVLEVRNTRNNWCGDVLSLDNQKWDLFSDFTTELETLNTDKSKDLLNNILQIKDILQDLNKNDLKITTEIKSKLIENYKLLWSLQSIQELTEFDKVGSKQTLEVLNDYEIWQKNYVQDNPKLKNKAVFINLSI